MMNQKRIMSFIAILLLFVVCLPPQATVKASDLVVTTTMDNVDADLHCGLVDPEDLPGPDTVTSLREAICAANNSPESDNITFNLGFRWF